ncbi:hypothetical protein [Paenibacillus solani]
MSARGRTAGDSQIGRKEDQLDDRKRVNNVEFAFNFNEETEKHF